MKSNKELSFPKRKITHLTNEETIYKMFVKTGRLEIDSKGRVWRNSNRGRNRAEVLIPTTTAGRMQSKVREYVNGKPIGCTTARLVYLHHHGRIPHMKVVGTRDGDPTRTSPKNLFLCTQAEATALGLQRAA